MKKILSIVILLFLSNKSIAEIVVLECKLDKGNSVMNLHINTQKNHFIQFDTRIFDKPQLGLTYKSKFFLAAELFLDSNQSKYYNNEYNDTANYTVDMVFFDINRYSGAMKMNVQSLDDRNFKIYLNKISSLRGTQNIYLDMFEFADKNDRPGYRLFDFGEGNCSKSNKKF